MRTILFNEEVPVSGEIQFWRTDPSDWAQVLDATHSLGVHHVSTYLSWRRHEPRNGELNFTEPTLDVRRFLTLCADRDIGVQIKPGPWICAEEIGGGLPDWVLHNNDIMALDYAGKVVSGYNPPFKHPVPSYASREYRSLVRNWYSAVTGEILEFAGPNGVIEAIQLDNEPSLAFQDAMYRSDYSPHAIAQFQDFIISRHGSLAGVSKAWGLHIIDVKRILPPKPGQSVSTQRESDWIAFREYYISDYLAFLQRTLADLGIGRVAAVVNLNTHPVRGIPQNGAHIVVRLRSEAQQAPIIVGEDHYFEPPIDENDLMQLELGAALGIASGTDLVWSPEMQAGIWRSPGVTVHYPDPLDGELAAWWGLAFAYGYQGFNLYMLADRENWEGAPLGRNGRVNVGAEQIRELLSGLNTVPNFRTYRPVPAANLIWDRRMLERSFATIGTQAEPVEPWTDETIVQSWRETLEIARQLTAADVPYKLCRTPDDVTAGIPTYGPSGLDGCWRSIQACHVGDSATAPISADRTGVAVRRLLNPQGAEIVVVAAWQRGGEGDAVLLQREGGWHGELADLATGEIHCPTAGGIRVAMPDLGVRIFLANGS